MSEQEKKKERKPDIIFTVGFKGKQAKMVADAISQPLIIKVIDAPTTDEFPWMFVLAAIVGIGAVVIFHS